MKKEARDPLPMLAQIPNQSPADIDAILKEEAQYCVENRTFSSLLHDVHQQLLPSENPSILVSLAHYTSNVEVFKMLWDRATQNPRASDAEILTNAIRRACVLNRLIPLNRSNYFWDYSNIEWLIISCKREENELLNHIEPEKFEIWEQQQQKRSMIWWDLVTLLQNESISPSTLSDAIAATGPFAQLDKSEHVSLLHHLSINSLLGDHSYPYETGDYQGWLQLKASLRTLLDRAVQSVDFRSAIYDILISLSPSFSNQEIIAADDSPAGFPARLLQIWQYPSMAEILTHGGETGQQIIGTTDLMPIVAFATWPSNVPAGKAPSFFVYASEYVTEDLSLAQMLKAAKKDGNLFCILAMWNGRVMRSATKRTMLRHIIETARGPIFKDTLLEIYEKRLKIWRPLLDEAEGHADDVKIVPKFSDIKWPIKLKRFLRTSTKYDDLIFDVAKEIHRDQRGSLAVIFQRGAERVLTLVAAILLIDHFLMDGEVLNALLGLAPSSLKTK